MTNSTEGPNVAVLRKNIPLKWDAEDLHGSHRFEVVPQDGSKERLFAGSMDRLISQCIDKNYFDHHGLVVITIEAPIIKSPNGYYPVGNEDMKYFHDTYCTRVREGL